AAPASARARLEARLPARGPHGRARRRRPVHRAHDPCRDRRALRLRSPGARPARRDLRPRPSRAADPSRIRRQEPSDLPQPAHPGATRRGGRGRPRPARTSSGGKPMTDIRVLREELPPKPPSRRHLISIADLTREDVERLLATARSFEAALERELKKL